MGTSMSTRWNSHTRKRQVDEMIALPFGKIAGNFAVRPGESLNDSRLITIRNGDIFHLTFTLDGIDADLVNAKVLVRNMKTGETVEHFAVLHREPLRNRGSRWLVDCLACPVAPHRVADLYLEPGMKNLGCRISLDLTYPSEMHDKALDPLKKALREDRVVRLTKVERDLLSIIKMMDKSEALDQQARRLRAKHPS